ncbi:MAG: LysR family transcriptional regulator [Saprospiraceae bacterium]
MPDSNQTELRHLRYFLAVAEDLHFRKAAERLYISQPGLSRQIKQMEENLGVELFRRHNRSVQLTKAGEYLKIELTKNLSNLEHILSHSKLLNDGKGGNLKLGYVGSAMQEIIPNILLKFRKHYPTVVFNLKELDNQKQIEGLLVNEVDLGFVRLDRVPRGLEMIPLLEENFCLVLPKKHAINTKNFEHLSQLKDESFILFDSAYSPSYFEKVMQIFDDSGFSPLVSHSTIHASSIFKLVENHFGISIIPKSLAVVNHKKLQFLELDKIKQKTILSAAWNTENQNPMLARVLRMFEAKS